MNLNGKNAIITGGSSGIGYAITKELLKNGVQTVGIFDINENKNALDDLRKEFKTKSIEFYQIDVKFKSDIKKGFRDFQQKNQYVDVLVNSAGILNEYLVDETIQINLIGLINCTYEAIDIMSTSNKGRGGLVVNVASGCIVGCMPHIAVYAASKHGVVSFTQSMANDIYSENHGVKFIVLCPGGTTTNLIDSTKMYRKEFLATGVAQLESMVFQSADEVGICFGKIVPIAENGSTWIIDNGEFHEYKSSDMKTEANQKN